MTDRCTAMPDGNLAACCHAHDRAYGIRGTVTQAEADRALRSCITRRGHPARAWIIWLAVRLAGWAWWKTKPINTRRLERLTDHELHLVRDETLRQLRRQYALRKMAW